jgi:ATP-dependent Clp protease adaptor protein ClpS
MMNKFSLLILAVLVASSTAFTAVFPATRISSTRHVDVASRVSLGAGPSVLEPAIAKPQVVEKVEVEKKTEDETKYKKRGWAVRLFNDPMNKREFVAMCLSKVAGLTDGQAYQVMMQAHQNGVSVVGRYDQERAELYRDSLRDNGLTVDMIEVSDD